MSFAKFFSCFPKVAKVWWVWLLSIFDSFFRKTPSYWRSFLAPTKLFPFSENLDWGWTFEQTFWKLLERHQLSVRLPIPNTCTNKQVWGITEFRGRVIDRETFITFTPRWGPNIWSRDQMTSQLLWCKHLGPNTWTLNVVRIKGDKLNHLFYHVNTLVLIGVPNFRQANKVKMNGCWQQ